MKKLAIAALAIFFVSGASYAYFNENPSPVAFKTGHTHMNGETNGAPSHGGGCRKNSFPGQCCHLETATGIVHCH